MGKIHTAPTNKDAKRFPGLVVSLFHKMVVKVEFQSSFLMLETAVEKTIPP